jgi:hypothetical protein
MSWMKHVKWMRNELGICSEKEGSISLGFGIVLS